MAAKTVLVLCAQALLIQIISAQYLGAGYAGLGVGLPCAAPLAAPLAAPIAPIAGPCSAWPAAALAASNGPGLAVTSASPIPPIGVSVASENVYEGPVTVAGALPFLGTVALEGALPTAGAGAVAYNCASGLVGITAEDAAPLGLAAAPLGYASGPLGYGYADGLGYGLGAPFGARGCGAYF